MATGRSQAEGIKVLMLSTNLQHRLSCPLRVSEWCPGARANGGSIVSPRESKTKYSLQCHGVIRIPHINHCAVLLDFCASHQEQSGSRGHFRAVVQKG